MKLIDEKGRLFGKINLIDLLVVLLIVAVLAAVVWKLGGKKAAAAVTGADKKAVEFEDVPADIAEYAKTQTQKSLVNDSKLIDAVITDVQTEVYANDFDHVRLYITVEASASFTGNVYKVGPQEVRVGYEYILKTSEFELTGLISALEVTDG